MSQLSSEELIKNQDNLIYLTVSPRTSHGYLTVSPLTSLSCLAVTYRLIVLRHYETIASLSYLAITYRLVVLRHYETIDRYIHPNYLSAYEHEGKNMNLSSAPPFTKPYLNSKTNTALLETTFFGYFVRIH